MNGRRGFVAALVGIVVGVALPGVARGSAARIGYLLQTPLVDPPTSERAAFLDELRRLGYSVGKDLLIEYRSAENEPEFLEDLARELVQLNVDAIVTTGVPAAVAAAHATHTTPIVFITVPDPVAIGLVKSLARPEGNVTGVAWESESLVGKRIDILREMIPGARRLAIMWDPGHPQAARSRAIYLKLAKASGLASDEYRVDDPTSLERAFASIERDRPDALYVISDPRMVTYREIIASEALRLHLPSIFSYQGYTRAGGLVSYSANLEHVFRRAAIYVGRILRGAKPGDLPVEQPARFELVVNRKTARAIGLKVPRSILLRADRVIE
jgi:putative ABC transport system substrate-binding protein